MKFRWNMLLQIFGVAIQTVNALGGVLPPKAQAITAVTVGVAQAATAAIAHFSNPDGTSAQTAYDPANPAGGK